MVPRQALAYPPYHGGEHRGKVAMLPAPTQWRQRGARGPHVQCVCAVHLALIAAKVNGQPQTLEHS